MVENALIISSRRAYEFAPDDLRLTRLTVPDVQQAIQQAFAFSAVAIGTPMETFGGIPPTLPPGLVFNFGAVSLPDGAVTPIRFLHFEPYRMVIDVAGPSGAIDVIYERLMGYFESVRAADGKQVLGRPKRVADHSEVSSHVPGWGQHLVSANVASLLQRTLRADEGDSESRLALSIQVRLVGKGEEYAGPVPHQPFLQLEPRAGSDLSTDLLFSAGPLTSDAHLAFLEALQTTLNEQG